MATREYERLLRGEYFVDRCSVKQGRVHGYKDQPYSPNLSIKRISDGVTVARITQVSTVDYTAEYVVCVLDDKTRIKHIERFRKPQDAVSCAMNNLDKDYDPDGVAVLIPTLDEETYE